MRTGLLLYSLLTLGAAKADVDNIASLERGALSQLTGHGQVNQAAGYNNLQFNAAAISLSDTALATVVGLQQNQSELPELAGQDVITIEDDVGQGLNGRLAINLVAGSGNVSGNVLLLAAGGQAKTQFPLLQLPPSREQPLNDGLRQHQLSLSDSAFTDGQGVFQLNVVTGSGNSALNVVSITESW